MRQHGDAQGAFRRALDLNPNFALAHARLAQPLYLQGAYQQAIDSAEHALRLSPRDRLVGALASEMATLNPVLEGRLQHE
jgi:adenylate cyclase